VPLEAREHSPPTELTLGVRCDSKEEGRQLESFCTALDAGLCLSRDICGSDPERMGPGETAAMVQAAFSATQVAVSVTTGEDFHRDYPLASAVSRASTLVERHRPCMINLEYTGAGPIERTVFLVGKGIVYDTGGADIKTGGRMAGMHRDKGGAAAVAGFFHSVAALQPKGLLGSNPNPKSLSSLTPTLIERPPRCRTHGNGPEQRWRGELCR